MSAGRAGRIARRSRHPHWRLPPLRIDADLCTDCDVCIGHCPPQFGAIFHMPAGVVIVPELCSGCGLCVPPCPVDCIQPHPDWREQVTPPSWWRHVEGHDILLPMTELIPGADPWSHHGTSAHGALVLHGFTGNPGSMRGVAEALAAAGYHVEMPLLPGHGTVIDDMLPTRWADWAGAAEAAYQTLAERTQKMIVVGLSMGGALTLRVGADHPQVAGLVCINPATVPQPEEVLDGLRGMLAAGTEVMPGIGSDIADPDAHESAYPGTPLAPLLSFLVDGLGPLVGEYPKMRAPLLLLNSPQDHVVDPAQSDQLAELYGGPVRRVPLERSYHVATQDYDKQLVFDSTVAFAGEVLA